MLGIWRLRRFELGAESGPVDCVAKDDDYALTNEEVDRIVRSLIEDTPLDEYQEQEETVDSAPRGDGSKAVR
jgi:hypothetical protein